MTVRPEVLVVDDHAELAQLLAAALERRGLSVRVAGTGEQAIAMIAHERPAAALVDLMLPDVLGIDVLDALAACTPPVPAVAMSGVFRGSRYAREAEEHGAGLFVEKPFSTKEVIDSVVDLVGPIPELPEEDDDLDVELSLVVEAPVTEDDEPFLDAASVIAAPERDADADASAARRRRRMGFVEDLIAVEGAGAPPAPREGAVIARPPTPRTPPKTPATPSSRGDLSTTTVPRLLAAFHQAGTSGALALRRGPVTKLVHLREGRPVFAASNLAGDRLLTFAARTGAIRKADAEAALRLAKEGKRRVGELLVELGILDKATLRRVVVDQVRAVIWSTFAWREGTFEILTGKKARHEPIALDLPLGSLVLEGVRRAVPLAALRRLVPDDIRPMPRQAPVLPVETLGLDNAQAQILAAADGTKTVDDLVAVTGSSEHDVRALLAALMALDVLGQQTEIGRDGRRVGFIL